MNRARSAYLRIATARLSTFQNTKASLNIISDAFNQFTTRKAEATREKHFNDMLNAMTSSPNWSLRPWKQIMEEQLNSWVLYIPGMANSKEVTDLKGMKAMLDVMTDEELDNPDRINGVARERISTASKKPIEDVRMLLYLHKQSKIVHNWIKLKHDLKEPLPKSERELSKMMESDHRVRAIAKRIMNPTGKAPGKGKRMF